MGEPTVYPAGTKLTIESSGDLTVSVLEPEPEPTPELQSVYWGALHSLPLTASADWDAWEQTTGKEQSVLRSAKSMRSSANAAVYFTDAELAAADARGCIPCVDWLPQKSGRVRLDPSTGPGSNAWISNGNLDAQIDRQAAYFKTYGKRVIVRLGHEANLGTSWPWCDKQPYNKPGSFSDMYRHVVDRIYAVAPLVEFWWCPNWTPAFAFSRVEARANLLACYPGDSYVHWYGVDLYNKPNTYRPPDAHLAQTYDVLTSAADGVCKAIPGQRFSIGEFGCSDALFSSGLPAPMAPYSTPQGKWTFDMLVRLVDGSYPKLGLISYFNATGESNYDYRLETKPDCKQAFRDGIANPIYLTSGA